MSTLAQGQCQIIGAKIRQNQFSKYITSYKEIPIKITPKIQKKMKSFLYQTRGRANTISYGAYNYIYLKEQAILQTLNKRDIMKFNNKFPMKMIDAVRGNVNEVWFKLLSISN